MAKTLRLDQRELGAVVLERLAKEKNVPAALKPIVKDFAARQKAFEAAAKKADAARGDRDDALDAVAAADGKLDQQLDVLADALVGAKLGPRKNPFAPFGAPAPAHLQKLAYTNEVEQVQKLVAAVKKKKPSPAVTKVLTATAALAQASKKALLALVAPQTAYVEAMSARDALLIDWTRAFERLRAHAKAAWIDSPGTYHAIFAPPGLEAHRPAKRRAKPAPVPVPAPPAPPPAPPQPTV